MRKTTLLLCFSVFVFTSQAQMRELCEIGHVYDQSWFPQHFDTMIVTSITPRNDGSGKIDTFPLTYVYFRNSIGRIDSAWGGFHLKFSNDTFFIDTFLVQHKAIGTHFSDSSVFVEQDYQGSSMGWQTTYRVSVHYRSATVMDRWYREYYQQVGGWDGQMTRFNLQYNGSEVYTGVEEWRKGVSGPFTQFREMTSMFNGALPNYDSVYYFPDPTRFERLVYTISGSVFTRLDARNDTGVVGYILFSRYPDNHLSRIETVDLFNGRHIILQFKGTTSVTGMPAALSPQVVEVYPNPVVSQVNIVWPIMQDEQTTVTITDITGNILVSTTVKENMFTADTRLWPAGCYIVRVSNNRGVMQTRKIIKQ